MGRRKTITTITTTTTIIIIINLTGNGLLPSGSGYNACT